MYANIRSIRNKINELTDIINSAEQEIHIIALTETWLYPNEETVVNIEGFSAIHQCRNTRGGGSSLFLKNRLTYVRMDLTLSTDDKNIVMVYLKDLKISICCIYKPPNSDMKIFLSDMNKIMDMQKNECVILGDMNLNLLANTTTVNEYKNLIEMNGFQIQNYINSENATRQTENTATILDHVLSNKNITCDINLQEHMITDHKILFIKLNKTIPKNTKEIVERTRLNKQKWIETVKMKLEHQEITSFRELSNIISTSKSECTKKYKIKILNNNKWVTPNFMSLIKERDIMYKRWKRLQSVEIGAKFKKLKNKVNNLRKYLKTKFVEEKLNKAGKDTKKVFNVLNSLCGKSKKQSDKIEYIKNTEGRVISGEQEIVEQFNTHFSTIGQNLAQHIPTPQNQFQEEETPNTIYLEPTYIVEIYNIVQSLKNNCAPGEDNITKNDIVLLFDSVGDIIVNLINTTLSSGIFPDELKIAKITPIFKKGSHTELGNYRPISVLTTFSKIVEKVIKSRTIAFVEKYFKFDKYQYGFQKKSNTLGATTDLVEHITEELDKNKYVLCVFIDLQKAFDTVDINILLEKLNKMGIRGVANNLMRTYSKNRKHYTVLGEHKSKIAELNVGVAQGSVLGPVQYLLYVHSLQYLGLRAKYYKFADDTVLVFSASDTKNLEKLVNDDLKLYYSWLCKNKLSININKSVYMTIKQKNKPKCEINVYLNNVKLIEVSEYKYLGLVLTNRLTWEPHIQNVMKKIAPMVGAIRRCTELLNDNSRNLLYNSFILPHLRYLIPCWGNAPQYLMDKVQRTQNKAIKTIFKFEYLTPTEEIYDRTRLLDIKKLKTFEQVKLIYNVKNKQIKTNLEIETVRSYHTYPVRCANHLRNANVRTTKAQNSPLYQCIETFNKIPRLILEVKTVKELCHNLKTLLTYN